MSSFPSRVAAVVLGCAAVLALRGVARAEEEPPPVATRVGCRALHRACLDARNPDHLAIGGDAFARGRSRAEQRRLRERIQNALLEIELGAAEFTFDEYDFDSEVLSVDARRNLRLFGGRMSFYPGGGEALAFPMAPDRAREVVALHKRRAVRLRIGFLLGHDDPDADPCLLRPGVPPVVRADVASFELVDQGGRVLAREDTPRLADAHTLESAPASGSPTVSVTVAPPGVTGDRAYATTVENHFSQGGADRLAEALRRCVRAEGPTGTLVVELVLDGSGQTSDVRLEVDSLHEDAMSECVRGVVAGFPFPAGPRRARVRVSVPVMITRE